MQDGNAFAEPGIKKRRESRRESDLGDENQNAPSTLECVLGRVQIDFGLPAPRDAVQHNGLKSLLRERFPEHGNRGLLALGELQFGGRLRAEALPRCLWHGLIDELDVPFLSESQKRASLNGELVAHRMYRDGIGGNR